MPLSWNEIKDRALRFSREWADEVNEHAEAKSFWDSFSKRDRITLEIALATVQ